MAKRGQRSAAASKHGNPKKRGRPRQQELIEDRAIAPLEAMAEDYADARDRRMELTKEEVETKKKLLGLMKQHGKQTYHRGGITVKVIVEKEKVQVRVRKKDEPIGADVPARTSQSVSEFDDPNAGEQARP
jgi:hypothetical protein